MALEIVTRGGDRREILSQGEFRLLTQCLDPSAVSPTLTAWSEGQDITPAQLAGCLDTEARIMLAPAKADQGDQLINMALDRLEQVAPEISIPS
jgi:hypothetical protein